MEERPLVSILMTAYNREKYIAEAIESVLASSYQNWELIVVDDQSKDKTLEIARSYELRDPRIKVILNDKNLGDYPNRNKAASFARGRYIKYLDADDLIYWYGLEAMVLAMETYPCAALGVCHSKPEELKPYPYQVEPEEAFKEHFLGRGLFNYGPTGMIIRRTVFEEENGFKSIRYIGDTDLLYRLGAKYPIVKMAPGLIWWRQHEGQEIVKELADVNVFNTRYQYNIETLKNQTTPLSDDLRGIAIRRQKQHHARKILAFLFVKRNFRLAWSFFRSSNLSFFELLRGLRSYT